MSFTSIWFLFFFILTILGYYILPKKIKNIWLLFCSLFFYLCASKKAFIVLVFIIIVSYILGILVDLNRGKRIKKALLTLGIVLILGILIIVKYSNFFINNINYIFDKLDFSLSFDGLDIVIILGISFFTLQAIGYIIDVYRGDVKPEKNLIDFALFLSFFPYITMGPIERAKNMLPQIKIAHRFDYQKFCHGMQMILWGYFLKIVIAERLCVMANSVFNDYMYFSGVDIVIGILIYTLQIYFDFAGYSWIARGTAAALGFDIMVNFKQPYFARSVSEFWRRWHIGLSSWLRDYIYIPLGGNRKGRVRKYINVMIVFLISGLWHGASWKFLIWGGIHGFYQVFGAISKPVRDKITMTLKANKECFSYKLLQVFVTFIPVSFAWLFFRAENLKTAFLMLKRMVLEFNLSSSISTTNVPEYYWWEKTGELLKTSSDYSILDMGLTGINLFILFISLLIAFGVDVLSYKRISVIKLVDKQNIWFRWMLYLGLTFFVIVLGIYGTYNASSFVYANF